MAEARGPFWAGPYNGETPPVAQDMRRIPNRELLLKVFCDEGKHLVAVVTRGRALVTGHGTSAVDKSREVYCRCTGVEGVRFTDPDRLRAQIDPSKPRTVRLSLITVQ